MSNFAGKTVLVTGASTGIGLGIAAGFAEAGANVAMTARGADRLEQAAAGLRARGFSAQAFPVDVADRAAVQGMCEAVAAAFGGIDVLCANAGIYPVTRLEDLGEDYVKNATTLIPVGRIGQVRDIANAVMFFASPDTGFITGQGLVIDGGQTLPEAPE